MKPQVYLLPMLISMFFAISSALGPAAHPMHFFNIDLAQERPQKIFAIGFVGEVLQVDAIEPEGMEYKFYVLEDIKTSVIYVALNDHIKSHVDGVPVMSRRVHLECKKPGE